MMALSEPLENGATIDFRQLRHQTKNALARILAQVTTGFSAAGGNSRAVADVERQILLTAKISDALFGLTREPGPFADRLQTLCEGVVSLAGEDDQYLTLSVHAGAVPLLAQAETLLRVAHEFVGNAVKHGMHMRLIGRIDVSVTASPAHVVLEVSDDGWGCSRTPCYGEGMRVASVLAGDRGGTVSLERRGDLTIARLLLPRTDHA